ncbi:MAG: hypothetical protein RMY33_009840 [Nostoc sp. DedQUE03]|nr:hypothetical protein [Nostoc sp. DedQUE02]
MVPVTSSNSNNAGITVNEKISIYRLIYFPTLKAMPAAGYANAKIFVNKQGLMRLFLRLLRIH